MRKWIYVTACAEVIVDGEPPPDADPHDVLEAIRTANRVCENIDFLHDDYQRPFSGKYPDELTLDEFWEHAKAWNTRKASPPRRGRRS